MQTKLATKHNSLASDVCVCVCVCVECCCVSSLSFSLNMSEVNIATLNVNGAREMRKRAEIFEVFKQKKLIGQGSGMESLY